MALKLFAGAVAVVLFISYLLPLIVKLKEVALVVVVLIGLTMMLIDLWQSLRGSEE